MLQAWPAAFLRAAILSTNVSVAASMVCVVSLSLGLVITNRFGLHIKLRAG